MGNSFILNNIYNKTSNNNNNKLKIKLNNIKINSKKLEKDLINKFIKSGIKNNYPICIFTYNTNYTKSYNYNKTLNINKLNIFKEIYKDKNINFLNIDNATELYPINNIILINMNSIMNNAPCYNEFKKYIFDKYNEKYKDQNISISDDKLLDLYYKNTNINLNNVYKKIYNICINSKYNILFEDNYYLDCDMNYLLTQSKILKQNGYYSICIYPFNAKNSNIILNLIKYSYIDSIYIYYDMYKLLFNITQNTTSKLLKIYISNDKFNNLKLDMNYNLLNYINNIKNMKNIVPLNNKKSTKKKHYRKIILKKNRNTPRVPRVGQSPTPIK